MNQPDSVFTLNALAQWICDECGQIINNPKDGYLEWTRKYEEPRSIASNFRIVHQAEHRQGSSGMSIDRYLGKGGIIHLLLFIDPGPYHQREYKGPEAQDLREWVEIFRRLHIPHYEEARKHWGSAFALFAENAENEISIYLEPSLREVVARYESGSE